MPDEDKHSAEQGSKTSGKKANPLVNNFLAATVFTAFLAAVTAYLKTAEALPEKLRYPVYVTVVIVLVVILAQFAINTVRLMQIKHTIDIKTVENEAARLDNEKKKILLEGVPLDKALDAATASRFQEDVHPEATVVVRSSIEPSKNVELAKYKSEDLDQVQTLGLQGNEVNEQQ